MPTTRMPNFNESPLFLRGEGGRLTPVAPLGEARSPCSLRLSERGYLLNFL